MENKLLRLGFLEIACYLKSREEELGQSLKMMPDLSKRELEELLYQAYEPWKNGEISGWPCEASRLLGLSEGGSYYLLMAWLFKTFPDFKETFSLLDPDFLSHEQQDGYPDIHLVKGLLWENHRLSIRDWDTGIIRHLPDPRQKETENSLSSKEPDPIYSGVKEEALRLFTYLNTGNRDSSRIEAVCISGPEGAGKKACAGYLAGLWEKKLLTIDACLCQSPEKKETIFSYAVSAVLNNALLCIRDPNIFQWPSWRQWGRWLRDRGSLLIFTLSRCEKETGSLLLRFHKEILHICLPVPDMLERSRIWDYAAGNYLLEPGISFSRIANQYNLTAGQIQKVFAMAQRQSGYQGRDQIFLRDIETCCHSLLREDFGSRAISVAPRHSWEDLILPPYQKEKLLAAVNQAACRHQVLEQWGLGEKMTYGTGISLIFAGPPGTGKTMAAQILAGKLGMELYKVELAAIVSKYIGETEKNLEQIFQAAQKSQVVLFFDEADALFSKRTEVRDSNDKYSNMEAAFLLQKMEEYTGVSILATNLLHNVDEAFKRRMKFIVDFPFPGKQERLQLWKRAIPGKLPVEDELDLEFLAEHFELSGSNIRNIVYHGAFLAAGQGRGLEMGDLIKALRNEYEKGGKTLTRQEAEPYGAYLEKQ